MMPPGCICDCPYTFGGGVCVNQYCQFCQDCDVYQHWYFH